MLGGVQPRRDVRSQARAEQVRGQAACRDAVQGRARTPFVKENVKAFVHGEHRHQAHALPDADGLPQEAQERRADQRLVAERRRDDGRHRAGPLDVDHR